MPASASDEAERLEISDRPPCQLYIITPERIDPVAFGDDLAAALDAGPVACMQLRLKATGQDEIKRAVEHLMPIAHARDVAFLLNDDPALAAELGCDGVHLGGDDMPVATARALLGPDRIVGASGYDSRHRAIEAAEAGADYVAFGAFFPSNTKQSKGAPQPDILTWWQEMMTVPCAAIGGVTPENCRTLAEAGADFVCAIGAIWHREGGPGNAVRAFHQALQ